MNTESPSLRPALSVVVCTHNRARLLAQTLDGLTHQDLPPAQLEIIVVDNASSDSTAAVIASFTDSPHRPRYVLESRLGLSRARNLGVQVSRGEIIAFLDDDVLLAPGWAQALLAPFRAETGQAIGCVGGEVIPIFPDGLPAWLARWHRPLQFRPDTGPISARHYPMGANFAFRRGVLEAAGPFCPLLGRHGQQLLSGEDSAMVDQVRSLGFEVWFAPAAEVLHQLPASRTHLDYACRHSFDSARSRVRQRNALRLAPFYLLSRLALHGLKLFLLLGLVLLSLACFRRNQLRQTLVRLSRSAGYIIESALTFLSWERPRANVWAQSRPSPVNA